MIDNKTNISLTRQNEDIIESLSNEYISMFYVDLLSGKMSIYRMDSCSYENNRPQEFDELFSDYLDKYIDSFVDKEYIDRMRPYTNLEHIQKAFSYNKSFFVCFKTNEEKECYIDMRCIKIGNTEVAEACIIGFVDVTDHIKKTIETRNNLTENLSVIGAISGDYEFIGYIDQINNKIKLYSATGIFEELDKSENKILEPEIFDNFFKEHIYEPDFNGFIKNTNRYNVIKRLKKSVVNVIFRFVINNEKVYYSLKFVVDPKHRDAIIIGIQNVDEEIRAENKVREQQNLSMIAGLVGDYDCVGFIDRDTNMATTYQVDERYSLYLSLYEEVDYYEKIEQFCNNFVAEEDRVRFLEEMNIGVVKSNLRTKKVYHVEYNVKFDDVSMAYQSKFIISASNSNKILVGMHSIDEEIKKQLETEAVLEQTVKERTIELEEKNAKLNRVNEEFIETIANIVEGRDIESGEHIKRVKGFTRILATQVMKDLPEYHLNYEKVDVISSASALHDVGKIMIPDSILLKPGKLTRGEFEMMKTHCVKGCEILKKAPRDWGEEYIRTSLEICRWHHEKYDGTGYPDGLVGDQIPISAQIVSICDCFDALVTKRVYKPAYSFNDAYDLIESGACGVFSEKLIACFEKCRKAFFAESLTSLDDGFDESSLNQKIEHISLMEKQDIYLLVDDLKRVYDTVKIIDVDTFEVLEIEADGSIFIDKEKCYSMWKKDCKCDNCISQRACKSRKRQEKFEFVGNDIYHVTSKSIEIGGKNYALEIVSQMKDNLLIETYGGYRLSKLIESVNQKAYIDSLTKIKNRRYYDDFCNNLNANQAIALFDIDGFRKLIDDHGHSAGDVIIKETVECIKGYVSPLFDIIRYSGDEFLVIFGRTTIEELKEILHNIITSVDNLEMAGLDDCHVTISVGAMFDETGETLNLGDCDKELLDAKKQTNCYSLNGEIFK